MNDDNPATIIPASEDNKSQEISSNSSVDISGDKDKDGNINGSNLIINYLPPSFKEHDLQVTIPFPPSSPPFLPFPFLPPSDHHHRLYSYLMVKLFM